MKNFMDGVPIELEEAAWTDGASPMQALRTVVLPLMGRACRWWRSTRSSACGGTSSSPSCCCSSPEQLPASVSIFTFFGQYGSVVYGQLAAFSMLYSLPALLLYLVLSRRLGGGFALGGAVKG